MVDLFEIDPNDKADLLHRFSVIGPVLSHNSLRYSSMFDGKTFGRMSVFLLPQLLSWNEFYPFNETHDPEYHPELVGTGLGTIAHTLVLHDVIIQLLEDPRGYQITHAAAGGGREKQLERMCNQAAMRGNMSLQKYFENSVQFCSQIGFQTEERISSSCQRLELVL